MKDHKMKLDKKNISENERQLQTIFDLAPIGINQVAPDGKPLRNNLAMQRFLGYSDEELCGRPFTDWTHPDDVGQSLQLVRRLLDGESELEIIEKRYVRKNGEIVWGRTTVSAVLNDSGEAEFFITMVEDITERKRSEILMRKVSDFLISAASDSNMASILKRCLDTALDISDMDCGAVFFADKSGGLELSYAIGFSESFLEGTTYISPYDTRARIVQDAKPFYTNYSVMDASILKTDTEENFKAFAVIPIILNSQVIACFNIASRTLEEIPIGVQTVLERFAHVVGIIIGRAQSDEERRKSEQKFRSIFENSLDGIMFTSPDGFVFAANPAMCRMVGRTEDEICSGGRNIIVDAKDPRLQKALKEREETGKFLGELTLKRKDGSTFPVEISTVIFKSSEGDTRTCIIVRDFSERKKMEQELISREREYRRLIENLPYSIVRYDLELRRTYVNPAWEKVSSLFAAEALNMSIDSIDDISRVPAFAPKGYIRELKQVIETGIPRNIALPWENANGDKLFIDFVIVPEFGLNGEISGVLTVGRDISREHRLTLELENFALQLETVYDSLDEAVFVIEPVKRTIISCNAAAETILGYSRAELIGKNTEILHVNRKMYTEFGKKLSAVLSEKGVFNVEYRIRRKDGAVIFTEHTVKEVLDDSGQCQMLISVVRDITDRKKSLEALKRQEEELRLKTVNLEELNTALKVMLDQRETEKKRQEENYSDTVNNYIIPYLDRLRKTELNVLQKEYIDSLESNLKQILKPFRHHISEKMLRLTPSEAMIINRIKQGLSSKEIASEVNLSVRTIEFHRDNIRKKLGIKSRHINLQTYLSNLGVNTGD